MVNYRRTKIAGGTYFFTIALQDRSSTILIEQITLLGQSFRKVKKEHSFKTRAIIILPDHLHCVWELPPKDDNFSLRWQKIKSDFTKAVKKSGLKLGKNKHGEYDLWQRRFWEHSIRDEKDLENHVNYIHYNPVKHHLVENVIDWPFSSFHGFVAEGILDRDWAGTNGDGEFGE